MTAGDSNQARRIVVAVEEPLRANLQMQWGNEAGRVSLAEYEDDSLNRYSYAAPGPSWDDVLPDLNACLAHIASQARGTDYTDVVWWRAGGRHTPARRRWLRSKLEGAGWAGETYGDIELALQPRSEPDLGDLHGLGVKWWGGGGEVGRFACIGLVRAAAELSRPEYEPVFAAGGNFLPTDAVMGRLKEAGFGIAYSVAQSDARPGLIYITPQRLLAAGPATLPHSVLPAGQAESAWVP